MSCMNLAGEQVNELLYVGFNQDNGCFACGTENGFRAYNVDPFREFFRNVFQKGGIGIVEMLYRCNIMALVGGGRDPLYPVNKVMIWDNEIHRCIGELMFKNEVKAVKLRRDHVVVVLLLKVYVYRFSDLKLLDQISTLPNPRGLVSLCPDSSHTVLACPGIQKGTIRVELYDISKAMLIKAHDSDLAQIALNIDGSKIASASDKGTLIRVWDCATGELLRELRRGVDRAEIYCLCFNPLSTFLACSSDKGTVHIFSLTDAVVNNGLPTGAGEGSGAARLAAAGSSGQTVDATNQTKPVVGPSGNTAPPKTAEGGAGADADTSNARSGLAFIKDLLPSSIVPKYLASEWSYAQIRGLEGKSICAFDRDSSKIIVICANGTFLTSSFEEGGECERLTFAKFVKSDGEGESDSSVSAWTSAGGASGFPAPPGSNAAKGGAVPPTPPKGGGEDVPTLIRNDSSRSQQDSSVVSNELGVTPTGSTAINGPSSTSSSRSAVAKKLEESR